MYGMAPDEPPPEAIKDPGEVRTLYGAPPPPK